MNELNRVNVDAAKGLVRAQMYEGADDVLEAITALEDELTHAQACVDRLCSRCCRREQVERRDSNERIPKEITAMKCNCDKAFVANATECPEHGSGFLTKYPGLAVGSPVDISTGWACPCEPADAAADVTKPPNPADRTGDIFQVFCKRRDSGHRDGKS